MLTFLIRYILICTSPSGNSEEDAYSIRKFVADGNQIILGQSYAKNFGLYGERVGALSIVTSSPEETGEDRLNEF